LQQHDSQFKSRYFNNEKGKWPSKLGPGKLRKCKPTQLLSTHTKANKPMNRKIELDVLRERKTSGKADTVSRLSAVAPSCELAYIVSWRMS